MTVENRMRQKLEAAFSPLELTIENESHLHRHHASSPGTGESHFRVTILSAAFQGLGRIDRHRAVNAALADELRGPIHALAIKAIAPGEAS